MVNCTKIYGVFMDSSALRCVQIKRFRMDIKHNKYICDFGFGWCVVGFGTGIGLVHNLRFYISD